ncbi:hypothetical protein RRG08_065560 [Elysia crispata]|uniref:Uncharacterized protein n=1 Tax=Elysia crispata TaxID=231223 RepID=A0AAE0YSB1_9GAST|nr:hypothetical protein RRG08_065560 [Elysia crispata]
MAIHNRGRRRPWKNDDNCSFAVSSLRLITPEPQASAPVLSARSIKRFQAPCSQRLDPVCDLASRRIIANY